MDKTKLLDKLGADKEDRLLLAKVLDRAEQSHSRNIPASTDFLSPQQRVMAQELLHLAGIPETAYAALGGYEGAERTILLFLPDWLEAEDAQSRARCGFCGLLPKGVPSDPPGLPGSLMAWGSSGKRWATSWWERMRRTSSFWTVLPRSCWRAGSPPAGQIDGLRDSGGVPAHPQVRCEEVRDTSARCGWTRWRLPLPAGPGQGGSADRKR